MSSNIGDEDASKSTASDSVFVEQAAKDTPPHRPRLPDTLCHYSSRLDEAHGPLRTTSDGNLVDEESGDWLLLDTPPHDREDRELALQSDKTTTKVPAIGLPECKNGATGLDNSRVRKSLGRLLINKWTGSDRLPIESEDGVVVEKKAIKDKAKKVLHRADNSGKLTWFF